MTGDDTCIVLQFIKSEYSGQSFSIHDTNKMKMACALYTKFVNCVCKPKTLGIMQ